MPASLEKSGDQLSQKGLSSGGHEYLCKLFLILYSEYCFILLFQSWLNFKSVSQRWVHSTIFKASVMLYFIALYCIS